MLPSKYRSTQSFKSPGGCKLLPLESPWRQPASVRHARAVYLLPVSPLLHTIFLIPSIRLSCLFSSPLSASVCLSVCLFLSVHPPVCWTAYELAMAGLNLSDKNGAPTFIILVRRVWGEYAMMEGSPKVRTPLGPSARCG
ncbi:unnamed protein product [Protopolystoma xenopodis]|uniref:Uncharacterized protein n=1 Tax=Protopolystoma xenopodis TaxID=117903 RepID=A0A3S5BF65_9PLAT|nr:unnamed protein product [Protopolystoma xenopodis]